MTKYTDDMQSPAGWIVRVTISDTKPNQHYLKIYDVAIESEAEAISAVRKLADTPQGAEIVAIAILTERMRKAFRLKPGELKAS